eukprot:GHVR01063421.1.p1 GENE.GHVR01063421.1~~GHVR01063421.1.p1  ORF type:complete len:111 (-),score=9.11 GHVR01063421.1:2573-2905(-)
MNEGKNLYDKASTASEIEESMNLFTKAILKASSPHVLHLNHIFYMRGQCHMKLKHYEEAERDFQEAIAISDDKSKVLFYNVLGKCIVEMYNSDPSKTHLEEAIKCFEKAL